MTRPVPHSKLVECVARRLLSEMEDHGGVDEFCEKLTDSPEQYLSYLASGAIDCISLSDCLSPRITYGE